MFKFSSRCCCIFFCFIHAFLSVSNLEATTDPVFDFNVEEFINEKNLEKKIDKLLDIGLKYQELTGKRFHYKKFLKKAYKELDKRDAHVPKAVRKDIKKRIQRRIEERFLGSHSRHHALACTMTFDQVQNGSYNDLRGGDYASMEDFGRDFFESHSLHDLCDVRSNQNRSYNDPRDADYYGYSDGLRGAVLEVCLGAALIAVPCPVIQFAGGGLFTEGVVKVYNETRTYKAPERTPKDRINDLCNGRPREKRDNFSGN